MNTDEVSIRTAGRAGRITLTRPKALNALTHVMVHAIDEALDQWQDGQTVGLVLIDAEGTKAFCAGGDIAALYHSGTAGDFDSGRRFWADEYALNARISNHPIPYVAIMDGIVMGGGVGLSGHGSHRIVTERSMVAMPECGIGLIPDVGGTWLLAKAPGHLGEFLGLTGWRMTGPDAILAGFADALVPGDRLDDLKATLENTGSVAAIDDYRETPDETPLEAQIEFAERHFSHPTALDCLRSVEADTSEFAQKITGLMRRACPLALACTFEMVRRVRTFEKLEDALALEYRFTWRSMTEAQFLEGIRAQIIEKDFKPSWKPDRLEDVTPDMVDRLLAPLGDDDLQL